MTRSVGGAVAYAAPQAEAVVAVNSFTDVVALFAQKREMILQGHLVNDAHVVKFEHGHIALRLKPSAPQNLAGRVSGLLSDWTGNRWVVSLSREEGAPTIGETRSCAQAATLNEVRAHPVVSEVLKVFPGAQVTGIRTKD